MDRARGATSGPARPTVWARSRSNVAIAVDAEGVVADIHVGPGFGKLERKHGGVEHDSGLAHDLAGPRASVSAAASRSPVRQARCAASRRVWPVTYGEVLGATGPSSVSSATLSGLSSLLRTRRSTAKRKPGWPLGVVTWTGVDDRR